MRKFLTIILICLSTVPMLAQGVNPYPALTARYLYNFTLFTVWPENNFAEGVQDSIKIGIFGDTPVYKELKQLLEEEAEQSVNVCFFEDWNSAADCDIQVVYFSGPCYTNYGGTHFFDGKPVLTVAYPDTTNRVLPVIQLKEDKGKLAFEINDEALDNTGLRLKYQIYQQEHSEE